MHGVEEIFVVVAIVLMSVLTALMAVYSVGKVSHVCANEFLDFHGVGCTSSDVVNS